MSEDLSSLIVLLQEVLSQVHHSERGSVISDCLVTGSVMMSQVHHSERGSVISLIVLLQEVL